MSSRRSAHRRERLLGRLLRMAAPHVFPNGRAVKQLVGQLLSADSPPTATTDAMLHGLETHGRCNPITLVSHLLPDLDADTVREVSAHCNPQLLGLLLELAVDVLGIPHTSVEDQSRLAALLKDLPGVHARLQQEEGEQQQCKGWGRLQRLARQAAASSAAGGGPQQQQQHAEVARCLQRCCWPGLAIAKLTGAAESQVAELLGTAAADDEEQAHVERWCKANNLVWLPPTQLQCLLRSLGLRQEEVLGCNGTFEELWLQKLGVSQEDLEALTRPPEIALRQPI